MRLVSRKDLKWPVFSGTHAPCNKGVVVHYDGNNQHLANAPHSACIVYWNKTRHDHIASNGWRDIGYSFGVCPHGYVFEGRGFGYEQAAQRSDDGKIQHGNTEWTSVTFMSGPAEKPTAAQDWAFIALCGYLNRVCGVKFVVRKHSDFSDTDCPGDKLAPLVTGVHE